MRVKSNPLIEDIETSLNNMCIVMIPKPTYDNITKHAEALELTFSEFLAKAIENYIKQEVK